MRNARDWRIDLRGNREAPARARRAVRRAIGPQLDPGLVSDVELLVSELIANALRHSGLEEGDPVEVRIRLLDDRIRIEVADSGPGFEREAVRPGRGLLLLERLAGDWGTRRRPRAHVWFEMATGRGRVPERVDTSGDAGSSARAPGVYSLHPEDPPIGRRGPDAPEEIPPTGGSRGEGRRPAGGPPG